MVLQHSEANFEAHSAVPSQGSQLKPEFALNSQPASLDSHHNVTQLGFAAAEHLLSNFGLQEAPPSSYQHLNAPSTALPDRAETVVGATAAEAHEHMAAQKSLEHLQHSSETHVGNGEGYWHVAARLLKINRHNATPEQNKQIARITKQLQDLNGNKPLKPNDAIKIPARFAGTSDATAGHHQHHSHKHGDAQTHHSAHAHRQPVDHSQGLHDVPAENIQHDKPKPPDQNGADNGSHTGGDKPKPPDQHGGDNGSQAGGDKPKPPDQNGGDNGSHTGGDKSNQAFSVDEVAKTAKTYGVDQAGHGDCWFESSLAGLAHRQGGPEAISSMITKSPDGSGYVVTFPGDKEHPVSVSQAEIKADHLKDRAEWAKVTEAALIKHDPDAAEHGADPKKAIQLLTGKPTLDQWSQDVSATSLAQKLQDGPVVASTAERKHSASGGRTDVASRSDAVVPNHAYTVVSVDQDTGMVTVRNPWGHNNNTAVAGVGDSYEGVRNMGNGELSMSYQTFQQKFAVVSSHDVSTTAKSSD